jgi:hypothetical protein
MHAAHDPNLKAITEAPLLPQDVPPPPPPWFLEFIDELNEAAKDLADKDLEELELCVAPEHEIIQQRARAYSFGTAGWLQKVEQPGDRDHADPRSILAHDHVDFREGVSRVVRVALSAMN